MDKLLELLESANNIKSITYDKGSGLWEITYFVGKSDVMASDLLLDFLENG